MNQMQKADIITPEEAKKLVDFAMWDDVLAAREIYTHVVLKELERVRGKQDPEWAAWAAVTAVWYAGRAQGKRDERKARRQKAERRGLQG